MPVTTVSPARPDIHARAVIVVIARTVIGPAHADPDAARPCIETDLGHGRRCRAKQRGRRNEAQCKFSHVLLLCLLRRKRAGAQASSSKKYEVPRTKFAEQTDEQIDRLSYRARAH